MTCKWYDVCPLRRLERQGRLEEFWGKTYCRTEDNWQNCRRYRLEEREIEHPDNMLPNGEIDETLE